MIFVSQELWAKIFPRCGLRTTFVHLAQLNESSILKTIAKGSSHHLYFILIRDKIQTYRFCWAQNRLSHFFLSGFIHNKVKGMPKNRFERERWEQKVWIVFFQTCTFISNVFFPREGRLKLNTKDVDVILLILHIINCSTQPAEALIME